MSWRSAERAHTSYFNLKGLQNVWAREPWLSVEYLPPRQNAGLTLCSRSFVKRLKNEIAVKSLKCEQKAADSWIARMLLRNRAELRSCITPPNNSVWSSPSTGIVAMYSRMGRTSRRPSHRGVQSCRLLIESVQLPRFNRALSIRWLAEAGERSLLAWSIGLTMCCTLLRLGRRLVRPFGRKDDNSGRGTRPH